MLFRDYGLYDHAMLRFTRGHKLSENFYVRQDGTRAYYFSEGIYDIETIPYWPIRDKLYSMGHQRERAIVCEFIPCHTAEKLAKLCTSAGYSVAENRYIQRQTVNHKESLSVERIFIQGRFVKPLSHSDHDRPSVQI